MVTILSPKSPDISANPIISPSLLTLIEILHRSSWNVISTAVSNTLLLLYPQGCFWLSLMGKNTQLYHSSFQVLFWVSKLCGQLVNPSLNTHIMFMYSIQQKSHNILILNLNVFLSTGLNLFKQSQLLFILTSSETT